VILNEMLVRSEIGLPPGPTGGPATIAWMSALVAKFQMNAIHDAVTQYCTTIGTRGMTGFILTDTGAVSLRVLDETAPVIAQINIQSSAEIDVNDIVEYAAAFKWTKIDYKYLSRTTGLDVVTEGSMGGADATPTGELPPAAPDANSTSDSDTVSQPDANTATTAESASTETPQP
jgi:hypothetical protein